MFIHFIARWRVRLRQRRTTDRTNDGAGGGGNGDGGEWECTNTETAQTAPLETPLYIYIYIYIEICMNLRTYRWRVYMHIVCENWLNHVGIGWWNMVSFSGRPKTVCAMEWCRGPQTPSPYTQRCTRETSDGPILLLDSWWTGWRDAGLQSRGSLCGQRHSALTYFFFGFIVMLTLRLLYLFFPSFFSIFYTHIYSIFVFEKLLKMCVSIIALHSVEWAIETECGTKGNRTNRRIRYICLNEVAVAG